MSDGWLLHPDISTDEQFAQLDERAKLIYLLTLAHLDREGLIEASPVYILNRCVPGCGYDAGDVSQAIEQWVSTVNAHGGPKPLVRLYSDPPTGKDVVQFLGFRKRQARLLRLRFGRPSELPPPPDQLSIDDDVAGTSTRVARTQGGSARNASESALAGAREGATGDGPSSTSSRSSSSEPQQQLTRERSPAELRRLLESHFQELFQRPARLSGEQGRRLAAAASTIGVDAAVALIKERREAGADPQSLAFFVPVLEERAADRRAVDDARQGNDRERAERYVRQTGWGLTERALREELARFQLSAAVVDELVELGRGLANREEAAA